MISGDRTAKRWLLAGAALAVLDGGCAAAQGAAPALPAQATAATAAPADPAPAAATGATSTQLHEVTVTARRRRESLQSVPVAVSVVNGDLASSLNLNTIQDISALVPTAEFRTSASNKDQTIFIRGVGTISTSPGVEPSVSTVIDGVVLVRPGQATVDLLDLDHLEVLRGPQGTLFGKNAAAGAVNIVTKSPTDAVQAYGDASYFEGNEYRIGVGVSGPILGDKLLGRLSFLTSEYDGNVTNLYYGDKVNGYRRNGGRLKLIGKPNDTVTFTLNADLTSSTDSVPTGVWVSSSQRAYPTNAVTNSAVLAGAFASQGITPGADNRTISDNLNSDARDRNGGVSLQADVKLGGGYTLTSITAYRKWINDQNQDYDQGSTIAVGLPQVTDRGELNFDQVSQEIRIASPKGGLFDYVLGAYYLHDEDAEHYQRNDLSLVSGNLTPYQGVNNYGTTGDNVALFGEGDVNFTRSFRLILGYREIYDNVSYYEGRTSSSTTAVTGIQPSFAAGGATHQLDYSDRVGLQYDVTRAVMSYFTYSRGYQGPAYDVYFNANPTNGDTLRLAPETSNAYELGLKSRWWDNRLQANLALYLTDFYNYQANEADTVNGAIVTRLINAGEVSSKGVEGDFAATPIRNLNLTFAFARTNARVVDFKCPANAAASCNVNGEPLPFAPNWKLDATGDYFLPLTNALGLDFQSDYNWRSRTQYQLSETPDTIQPAYGIWNASLGVIGRQNGWSARLLVKNILNTHYSSYLVHGNLGGLVRFVPRDDDRYVGINLHKDL